MNEWSTVAVFNLVLVRFMSNKKNKKTAEINRRNCIGKVHTHTHTRVMIL